MDDFLEDWSGAAGDLLRRSYRLSGHKTSLSLERAFWDALKEIAVREGRTLTDLIGEIDDLRDGPLSRAVRLYILADLKRRS